MNFKKLSFLFFVCAFFTLSSSTAQDKELYRELYNSYENFKEKSIEKRRFTQTKIRPLIDNFNQKENFKVTKVGESIEGRPLQLISVGEGDVDIFLWSQMHGDESTATMAIFDILNFLDSEAFLEEKEEMLKNVKLHFLPMLNPDGAARFQRRNLLGVDINRDALRLQSPESKALKNVRDSLDADFGFNLHDQSTYYNAERTPKPATISYLAPAYNYEKSINEVRGAAMQVIVQMNNILQEYAPGQVGRYNDDFEPRAFGDNIQKWGTSTILIESGGYPKDPEKQEIRKLNFVSILAAIFSIADGDYKNAEISKYEEIPNNDRKLFDLKLTGLTYELLGEDYILDLGINQYEVQDEDLDYFYNSSISDQGDLSTYYGYEEFEASGYKFEQGKIYPETFENLEKFQQVNISEILKEGYSYVVLKELPKDDFTKLPINLVTEDFEIPENLQPNFFLKKDGNLEYAVINGFFIDLSEEKFDVENALILD
ncbi:M14 family metallopeptidase [Salegentibacter mishustinae]|uniref:Peptidase M14 n=1 Tax=Salegentibacter mishustinae TaxID=270918 RepID=A0A0Q9Z6K6_9FLAO|nr:M14 metallopeptidase family protein [Salegentibacter mishustinae]KRG28496.1 peptidase M14 [Salegentibacter mishustinae]PNW22431.1 peptidase M14 [Salegentibacter mishustinae]PZX67669.1 zinc carboxypeptidase [Salegentibacter mishustinae]GGW78170.1 peptidase M14 [Salegentibacter mishustinae]